METKSTTKTRAPDPFLPGELALRNEGALAGGDRPLAPGELPEQLVGLEELGPLAMQTVEALAIEGLKIQTDMTEQEAPYQVGKSGFSLSRFVQSSLRSNLHFKLSNLKGRPVKLKI